MKNYIQPNKYKRYAQITIWFYLAIAETFCICLDLFASVALKASTDGHPDPTQNIDMSLINQTIWLSTWVTFATIFWAIFNLINMVSKKMPDWMISRNNDTFIAAEIFIIFMIYFLTIVAKPDDITGFDNWWRKTKSILEHFINPVLVVVSYFVFADSKKLVGSKQYAQKDGWFILIFVSAWLIYVVLRDVLLREFNPAYATSGPNSYDNNPGLWQNSSTPWGHLTAFAYPQVDPWVKSPALWIPSLLAIEFGSYGIGNLWNFLGNLACKSELRYDGKVKGFK